jgi:hypothetical protein
MPQVVKFKIRLKLRENGYLLFKTFKMSNKQFLKLDLFQKNLNFRIIFVKVSPYHTHSRYITIFHDAEPN